MARILSVDDDPAMLRLLQIHLVEAGHEVFSADDATVAIKLLLRQHIDIVVTDFQMPYLDGIKLAQAIRNDPKTRHIPIVVLTGYEGEEVVKAALDGGANFVSKSAPMEEILTFVGRVLAREAGMPAPRRS